MVAFNFKPEFVPKIESGEKKQTIRRSQRCNPGDDVQLYTGQRTKKCRKIKDSTCTKIVNVAIGEQEIRGKNTRFIQTEHNGSFMQLIEGITCEKEELDKFAVMDGFENSEKMFDFFKNQYGLPFQGVIHVWL